jgi:hypothetical protein
MPQARLPRALLTPDPIHFNLPSAIETSQVTLPRALLTPVFVRRAVGGLLRRAASCLHSCKWDRAAHGAVNPSNLIRLSEHPRLSGKFGRTATARSLRPPPRRIKTSWRWRQGSGPVEIPCSIPSLTPSLPFLDRLHPIPQATAVRRVIIAGRRSWVSSELGRLQIFFHRSTNFSDSKNERGRAVC